ncbi:MAG: MATE family efflux transporter [Rhodobacteraceae bacterium]|nr:MATE family efflux transporter [Paracoccaceae bacterium]
MTKTTQSWGDHIVASSALGLPLIGSHIAQMLTHTTDVVMMGWYSVEGLAAVVLAAQIYFVVFIVGSGFAFAVMPMAASALGAGDDAQVRRSVRMGSWLVLAYGAVMLLPLWNLQPILIALGQEPHLTEISQEYMRIAVWGLFPSLLIMVLKSYLGALERAQIVLVATLVAAAANVVFNYAFIFGNFGMPEMGAEGAALASVLTITLDTVFLLVYVARKPALKKFQLFVKPLKPDWPALREVSRLGLPIGLTMLAEAGMFSAATLMVGWAGTLQLAAHGIVLQIASLSFMVPLGISNVATIRAGRALGRQDITGLWRGSVVVVLSALVVALVAMVVMFSFPQTLIALFLKPSEPDYVMILEVGGALILVAAAFQVVDAMQVVGLGLLRGIKDTTGPMIIAVFAYWVCGLPMGYYLAFERGFGAQGVWTGLVIGLGFASVALLWRYGVMLRRRSFELGGAS